MKLLENYISEASSLAIHSLAYIAKMGGERLNVRRIAETMDASKDHLAKVLQRLSKAGLVESVRGPKGGFVLTKPAEDITLLEIYEAMEGKMVVSPCPIRHNGKCPFKKCIFGGVFDRVTEEIKEYFEDRTLNDISL